MLYSVPITFVSALSTENSAQRARIAGDYSSGQVRQVGSTLRRQVKVLKDHLFK
jgi:hypothetical protein